MFNKLLSICIPSFNRPETLRNLLESIDINCKNDFEIIICEDFSSRRKEIRETVLEFEKKNQLDIKYYENESNFGYDKNLRELIKVSNGFFILFMGDDDIFVTENLKDYIEFLKMNLDLGFVLRAYQKIHTNGNKEIFKYYDKNTFFKAGIDAYIQLFRKSIFISGFTIRREYTFPYLTDIFDGTLLFQLYILSEVTLKYPSAFCNIVLTSEIPQNTVPFFGSAEVEKELYSPGEISIDNSLNFMKGFFKITSYIDNKYNLHSTAKIRRDISKYSYRVLSIQRKKGLKIFIKYAYLLSKILHLNKTFYFYLYFILLCLLGENICDKLLILLKQKLGRIPRF